MLSNGVNVVRPRAIQRQRPRYDTPCRRLLEHEILPFLARLSSGGDVLDVGTSQDTEGYESHFEADRYYSLDLEHPSGATLPGHHRLGNVLELPKLFSGRSFRVILINGVFGWGINTQDEAERVCQLARSALEPGGLLMIGWNTYPDRAAFARWEPFNRDLGVSLQALEATAPDRLVEHGLRGFEHYPIALSGREPGWRLQLHYSMKNPSLPHSPSTPYWHTFDFYQRRDAV